MPGDHEPKDAALGRADVPVLLSAAVASIGGSPRPGQLAMAESVAKAVDAHEHLLVQAGTGTGKSLGYLVPAAAHAVESGGPVVVATATLTLQAQIVERDLPRLADALEPALGRRLTWQLVKGRSNYLCRHKLEGGFPQDALFDVPDAGDATEAADHPDPAPAAVTGQWIGAGPSRLGREVVRLREWAETTTTGDRDELVPGVSERAWRQVSVTAHECLGATRCPQALQCHVEIARERARDVDVIVTNHAFVAIDAFGGGHILPEHDVLVVDEAHELPDRVTSVITDELTASGVEAAARAARRAGLADTDSLTLAGETFGDVLASLPAGRLEQGLPEGLQAAVVALRDAARALMSLLGQGEKDKAKDSTDGTADGARQLARAAVGEVFDVTERLAGGAGGPGSFDVVWVSRSRRPSGPGDGGERIGLHVAPLSVAGLLRERIFSDRSVVLTSATLSLGGSFDSMAGSLGLAGDESPPWSGLDVGSPFDYPRQAILYVAKTLPPPGRDGLPAAVLDELETLIRAAGGRTLGLFSSRRAAEEAADALRDRLDVPILCQGDDTTATLVRTFAAEPETCLFGTLSLWQGVDVPGASCQLVVVDRIPFPRPDDPLQSARARAVSEAGGNGFMAVSAVHAALRLAQGVGRLVRSDDDRGVVAVLDPRLATARYGGFLRSSLPPFWSTTDREVVLGALRRLDERAKGSS
ncbi:ATP-dependent DNA helicase [Spongisporangium articulatum]|uniref:DNA 5'-3' helicase n=1 Tax=Spongisporangium articulatum TaxID=3362603 RepID=A0ABW8AMI5_9ACTN